jgi:ubiquinone/menaquinone biosynthesis C-methylase UbiE
MTRTSYPPDFVTNLELQWGVGFLSPGGPEEVREILRDVEIRGMRVLDIGCGTAGPDLVIARELSAGRVIGIDVEAFLIEKGRKNVVDAGLEQVIELRLVEAGPLPFDDESFDIVFNKDSLIHVEDKSGLYREVVRVLRPGGRFAASDWLCGRDADKLSDYREWRSLTAHSFSMQTAEETTAELIGAGLDAVRTRDRTEWYVGTAAGEVEMMKSAAWRDAFVALFDEESYGKRLALRIANARAAACGGLRPTHIFGQRAH